MRKIKVIKIDADKCSGCRACEIACSTFHSSPKYSSTNPERSRIRVVSDPSRNIYVPVIAGPYTESECNSRYVQTINGKEYDECTFCRASCPSRNLFKEPDSGLPLKCDLCANEPPLEKPMCVQWCLYGALTYEEREEEGEEVKQPEQLETGLQELVNKHGVKGVTDTLARITRS